MVHQEVCRVATIQTTPPKEQFKLPTEKIDEPEASESSDDLPVMRTTIKGKTVGIKFNGQPLVMVKSKPNAKRALYIQTKLRR